MIRLLSPLVPIERRFPEHASFPLELRRERLAADGYRFDSLVESIVTSPQFLNQRIPSEVTKQ